MINQQKLKETKLL